MRHLTAVAVAIATLLAGGPAWGRQRDEPATVTVQGHAKLKIAGPFTHKNLSTYILYRAGKADRPQPAYITLKEGLKSGHVKITEGADERVQRLLVSNRSRKRLFLHIGELVRGGKQDRTLQTSLVVPPGTKKMPIPTFCVEESRWSGGTDFDALDFNAPAFVTSAIVAREQGQVWSNVRLHKMKAMKRMAQSAEPSANPTQETSSLNEELSDKVFQGLSQEYERTLKMPPANLTSAVGFAYAVNGRIATVDLYHANTLLRKLLPRLRRRAAAEAAAEYDPDKAGTFTPPTARDVADFIAKAWDGKRNREKLGAGNVFLRIVGPESYTVQLFYKDELIHSEVLPKRRPPIKPLRAPDSLVPDENLRRP